MGKRGANSLWSVHIMEKLATRNCGEKSGVALSSATAKDLESDRRTYYFNSTRDTTVWWTSTLYLAHKAGGGG